MKYSILVSGKLNIFFYLNFGLDKEYFILYFLFLPY